MEQVIGWIFVFIIVSVYEAMTVQLVGMWFSIGSLVTVFVAAAGASFEVQLIVFIVISFLSLIALRPIVKRYVKPKRNEVESLTGKIGTVIANQRVKIGHMDWQMKLQDGSRLNEGDKVKVIDRDGISLLVEKIG